jgi:hypothetical protein
VLLGSRHERGMRPMFQENLGSKFEVCSIFKSNAPLENVEDVRKPGKDLTKQDHIVTVGGAGNSLDTNQDYSINKYLNFIAEKTSNTNVGFVNLPRRYDKLWINGRVRNMNLQHDRALMGRDMSYIVTDTGTILREEYITHGLHLNSRGKMSLIHLTEESIRGGFVPNRNSSIPVITCARACPF